MNPEGNPLFEKAKEANPELTAEQFEEARKAALDAHNAGPKEMFEDGGQVMTEKPDEQTRGEIRENLEN